MSALRASQVWDDALASEPDCFLEAGSHQELVYLPRQMFLHLMKDSDHGTISTTAPD